SSVTASLRQATLGEFVFAFNCDSEGSLEKVKTMMDALMRKVQKGELQVNCLSRNTLEDVLADKLMVHDAQLQEDDLQKLCQVQVNKTTNTLPVLANFRLMLWEHLLIAYR